LPESLTIGFIKLKLEIRIIVIGIGELYIEEELRKIIVVHEFKSSIIPQYELHIFNTGTIIALVYSFLIIP
jgi:hypothetical protein